MTTPAHAADILAMACSQVRQAFGRYRSTIGRLPVALFVALATLGSGCNAILGNGPHDLAMDAADTADATAELDAATGDATAQEGGAPSDAIPLQDASQDRTIVYDGAGSTRDAVADSLSVSTTCVSGGDCSPNDCQSGTWGCVDGGRVCQLVSAKDGTPCTANADAGSYVCSAGKCAACNAGADCTDPTKPCITKSYDCTSGAAVCTARGNAPEGVGCGAGLYCTGGACAACQVGAACPPAANACHLGKVTACTGGVATCVDQGTNAPAGTSCKPASGASGACDGSGTCSPCSEGAQCNPSGNTCQVGVQSCSAGVQCKNAVFVQEGKTCGAGKICHAGACGACDGTSCAGGCCNSSGCVTALQTVTECGTGAGGGTCMACVGPSVGTGSAKCASNACTFACTGATPDACPGIGCVDLKTDDANCGQCGSRCAASTHCMAGSC
ncbi:MAG: hypothetical protein M3O46_19610, partial [Myxococcota bacterium]|nr:hypothetical protein [Myxococcota bacterium]